MVDPCVCRESSIAGVAQFVRQTTTRPPSREVKPLTPSPTPSLDGTRTGSAQFTVYRREERAFSGFPSSTLFPSVLTPCRKALPHSAIQ